MQVHYFKKALAEIHVWIERDETNYNKYPYIYKSPIKFHLFYEIPMNVFI